jgi:hypothetical protein
MRSIRTNRHGRHQSPSATTLTLRPVTESHRQDGVGPPPFPGSPWIQLAWHQQSAALCPSKPSDNRGQCFHMVNRHDKVGDAIELTQSVELFADVLNRADQQIGIG